MLEEKKKELMAALEALLFASGDAAEPRRLAAALDVAADELDELVACLQENLEQRDSGLAVVKVAGGFRLCTRARLAPYLEKYTQVTDKKLSQPLLEVLSIIAFKQPVTKQEVEEIRGVNSEKLLRRLTERDLIQEVGRKKVVGRPILYGTTALFLQCFGLDDIKDLPELPDFNYEERSRLLKEANLFNEDDSD